jgi:mono/diheme cytochrome c family protein
VFKNGQLDDFGDAVDSCLVEWMNAEAWSDDDPRLVDLEAFLDEAGDATDPISFEIVTPPADLGGGDATRGQDVFNGSCAVCHGADGVGTTQAIAVGAGTLEPEYAARRVRLSGRIDSDVYEGLAGGVMPFWAADRLSDDELVDIVAWLSRNYDPNAEPQPEPQPDPDPPNPNEGCPADHPKVGQVAQLEAFFHSVGGTAEIIDNCTIEIRDFTYDGAGIDVRLYGGLGGDYDAGFPMGEDLVQPGGYDGEILYFTIPQDKTLDDLDGVSVWCVDVGVDFGSGMFM